MKIEINLKGNKVVFKESNNLVDAKEIESVTYTEGDITTFAKPVKEFRGYTLKVTGKYNNKTGDFAYFTERLYVLSEMDR